MHTLNEVVIPTSEFSSSTYTLLDCFFGRMAEVKGLFRSREEFFSFTCGDITATEQWGEYEKQDVQTNLIYSFEEVRRVEDNRSQNNLLQVVAVCLQTDTDMQRGHACDLPVCVFV